MQSAAVKIISRGVELDQASRYTEALVCYQEGIQILLNMTRNETDDKAAHIRNKIKEYMDRAETIKRIVDNLKDEGKYHEQIEISNDSTGYSYEKTFGRFLGNNITEVLIEDPYIRSFHQLQNFVRFNEVLTKACDNLKQIKLVTTKDDTHEQGRWFEQIRVDLKKRGVELVWEFMQTLHDRKITLNNGWIIKIGRGLDYFKAPDFKLAIGAFDLDLRKCHQTTIDIFHSKTVRQL